MTRLASGKRPHGEATTRYYDRVIAKAERKKAEAALKQPRKGIGSY